MQQTLFQHKHYFSALVTGLLLCCSPLSSADPLTDPGDPPAPIIDTEQPTFRTIPAQKDFDAGNPIVTLEMDAEIAGSVEISDGVSTNVSDETIFVFNPTGSVGPLTPGQYTITWTATDLGFNSKSETQTINVKPAINLALDQQVSEGGTATVTAHLSGRAPSSSFPRRIPFTIGGDATGSGADYDIIDGAFEFNSPDQTSDSVSISINEDNVVESDETIVITLVDAQATDPYFDGDNRTHTITIPGNEVNHAPLAHLTASQAGVTTRAPTLSGGTVTISADSYDANGDTVLYDWSASDNALTPSAGTTGETFTFEPQGLAPGFYSVRLTISDGGGLSTSHDLLLVLLEDELELLDTQDRDGDGKTDAEEGFHDDDNDGVPNYLDGIDANPAIMQGFEPYLFNTDLISQDTLVNDSITLDWEISSTASNLIIYPLLLEVDPGHRLSLGPTAFAANSSYARISSTAAENLRGVPLDDDLVSSDGQVVDIEITQLSRAGASAKVIIPQSAPIPASQSGAPEFIVYSKTKGWETFVTDQDNTNQIFSGNKLGDNYCPGLNDTTAYTTSNNLADAECLLLTIEDGGPNDYDGVANGSIRLMGGVFIVSNSTSRTTPADDETFTGDSDSTIESGSKLDLGTGGGGGIGLISLLSLLIAYRFRLRA